jgi:protein-disulfide isomerase
LRIKEVLLNGATVLAVSCAIATSIAAFRRGGSLSLKPTALPAPAARPVPQWREFLATGHRIGLPSAALTIIEFGDFECPACAGYARMLDTVRARYPRDFAIVFHHLPLPYHHLAYPLARAAECAATQGKFVEFHDAVYAHPESLGIVPISHLGVVAGVGDPAQFDRCFADTSPVQAVDQDLASAKKIGAPGTPALIVDGQLRSADLRIDELESMIKRRVRGGAR